MLIMQNGQHHVPRTVHIFIQFEVSKLLNKLLLKVENVVFSIVRSSKLKKMRAMQYRYETKKLSNSVENFSSTSMFHMHYRFQSVGGLH